MPSPSAAAATSSKARRQTPPPRAAGDNGYAHRRKDRDNEPSKRNRDRLALPPSASCVRGATRKNLRPLQLRPAPPPAPQSSSARSPAAGEAGPAAREKSQNSSPTRMTTGRATAP